MDEKILSEMMRMLDAQEANCRDMGATTDENCLSRPRGGNRGQNSYYYGHLNMAQALLWEIHKDVIKENGRHVVINERTYERG